jgi:hypothetical protein
MAIPALVVEIIGSADMTMLDRATPLPADSPLGFRYFLIREWPYLLMVALALVGVAYTSVTDSPARTYWIALAPFIGLVCVATGWRDAASREDRVRLIWTQALHWGAVLLAMELIYIADATRVLTVEAGALSVLTVLALGAFTAGIHIKSWRICLVGLMLGLGVPGIVLLERSALLIFLIVAVAAAVIAPFLIYRSRTRSPLAPVADVDRPIDDAPAAAAAETDTDITAAEARALDRMIAP